jgi:hypothetical protein
MELLQASGWIALGFTPTLASLEIAFSITKRRKITLREEKVTFHFRNELI